MSLISKDEFYAQLHEAMRQRVVEALEAEIEPACERLRQRLRGEVAQVALQMMQHYSMYERQGELVITVKAGILAKGQDKEGV